MARDAAPVDAIAKRTLALLMERIPVTEAYLFGSSRAGTADEDSDIDIAAFSPAVATLPIERRIDLMVQVERQVGAPVELHLFSHEQLAEARPSNFFGYLRSHGKRIL